MRFRVRFGPPFEWIEKNGSSGVPRGRRTGNATTPPDGHSPRELPILLFSHQYFYILILIPISIVLLFFHTVLARDIAVPIVHSIRWPLTVHLVGPLSSFHEPR